MKKMIIFIFIVFYSAFTYSQQDSYETIRLTEKALLEFDLAMKFEEQLNKFDYEENFTNGQFLFDKWQTGSIIIKDTVAIRGLNLNYNIFQGRVLYTPPTRKNDIYYLSKPVEVSKIYVGKHIFIYCGFKDNDIENLGYFEQLNSGEWQILLRYESTFNPGKESNGYQPAIEPSYKTRKIFYLRKGIDVAFKIKKSKKDVLNVFKDKENELTKFIKKEKIKIKKDEDFVKLVQHYNSLIKK